MELHKLSDPLESQNMDFKPQDIFKHTVMGEENISCILVPFKDARVDMYLLDDICGADKWQNDYKRDSKGVLQGGIGIKCEDEWVWKWSNGTPSKFEKDKGEYSDAFKRAGFMWGIGRCLYDMPTIMVSLNVNEYFIDGEGRLKVSKQFRPNDWKWTVDWGTLEGVFKLTAIQIMRDGTHVKRFDSNPYNSKNQRK